MNDVADHQTHPSNDLACYQAMKAHDALYASQLRRSASTSTHASTSPSAFASTGFCTVKLSYRPPYDYRWLLAFFQKRRINAIEFIATEEIKTSAGWTLCLESGGKQYLGWIVVEFLAAQPVVQVQVSDSLRDVLPQVIRQVRA